MGKAKAVSQSKKTPTIKRNARPISKKQKERKGNKRLSNNVFKSDLKKLAFHEISKATSTSKQNRNKRKKHDPTNKHIVASVKRMEFSTKDLKNDNTTTEVSQKVQYNTDSKKKHRKRNKKQKQNISSDQKNKIAVATPVIKTIKKSQNIAKKVNCEQNKTEIQNFEVINQEKMKQISINKKVQQVKSGKTLKLNNLKIKFGRLEEMLNKKIQTKQTMQKIKKQSLTLRDRMMAQLSASRFRFINETLYNNNSLQSKQYFKEDPDAFKAYHEGYKQQIEQWPLNPLDIIISSIKKMPTDNIIADFGCGEAQLAASVVHEVHSFDFIALNDKVKACDITHTPLLMNSVHIVVFCLSLMGTNLNDYLIEANRVLKINGILKIAEVESRFENIEEFIKLLGCYGFKNTWKDLSHDLFYFMDFKKEEDVNMKKKTLPTITLKPCLYKKR